MENQPLDDVLIKNEIRLVEASKNKRFANYLIDYIGALIATVLLFTALEAMEVPNVYDTNAIVDQLQGMLIYAVYYIIVEGSLKGKSLGKYITNTRVVTLDGYTPDMTTIVKRSFSRAVPFEAFSFLGDRNNGWHDRWSDTLVIDETLSKLPNESNWG